MKKEILGEERGAIIDTILHEVRINLRRTSGRLVFGPPPPPPLSFCR